MDKIEVTIQFTAEDLQEAYKLHLIKMNPFRSRLLLILGIILVLLGGMLVFLQSMVGMINWMSWFFIVYGIIIVLYHFWRLKRMGRSAFKKLIEFHYPFTFSFTTDGVHSDGKTARSDNSWMHYQWAIMTSNMILLYPNKLRFIMLPRKYFSTEEYDQLCEWVKRDVRVK